METTQHFEKVSVEEVSSESLAQMDYWLSADEMEDVVEQMQRLARCLRSEEAQESPWTCCCDVCCEVRRR